MINLLNDFLRKCEKSFVDFYLDWLGDLSSRGVKVSSVVKTNEGELSIQIEGDTYSLFNFIFSILS